MLVKRVSTFKVSKEIGMELWNCQKQSESFIKHGLSNKNIIALHYIEKKTEFGKKINGFCIALQVCLFKISNKNYLIHLSCGHI